MKLYITKAGNTNLGIRNNNISLGKRNTQTEDYQKKKIYGAISCLYMQISKHPSKLRRSKSRNEQTKPLYMYFYQS